MLEGEEEVVQDLRNVVRMRPKDYSIEEVVDFVNVVGYFVVDFEEPVVLPEKQAKIR